MAEGYRFGIPHGVRLVQVACRLESSVAEWIGVLAYQRGVSCTRQIRDLVDEALAARDAIPLSDAEAPDAPWLEPPA